MIASFGFSPPQVIAPLDRKVEDTMVWLAAHCREVAEGHMALAERAEGLLDRFPDNRRFRTGLRTFARHHRRAAWQHLEMARRVEAAHQSCCEDFDMTDVVST